jgi:hypothetical protein
VRRRTPRTMPWPAREENGRPGLRQPRRWRARVARMKATWAGTSRSRRTLAT